MAARMAPSTSAKSPGFNRPAVSCGHYKDRCLRAKAAAVSPERSAPSMVAGSPVWVQSPARNRLRQWVLGPGRRASCAGVAAKVARFFLDDLPGRHGGLEAQRLGHIGPDADGEVFAVWSTTGVRPRHRDRNAVMEGKNPLRRYCRSRPASAGSRPAQRILKWAFDDGAEIVGRGQGRESGRRRLRAAHRQHTTISPDATGKVASADVQAPWRRRPSKAQDRASGVLNCTGSRFSFEIVQRRIGQRPPPKWDGRCAAGSNATQQPRLRAIPRPPAPQKSSPGAVFSAASRNGRISRSHKGAAIRDASRRWRRLFASAHEQGRIFDIVRRAWCRARRRARASSKRDTTASLGRQPPTLATAKSTKWRTGARRSGADASRAPMRAR